VTCCPVAWVLGSERPAFSIGFAEPLGAWDSGFKIIYQDAPDPEELEEVDSDGSELVCLHCLIDHDPALGRGLDLAKEYGVADLSGGEWFVGDLSRVRPATLVT
jgi:hypothetical protein